MNNDDRQGVFSFIFYILGMTLFAWAVIWILMLLASFAGT